MNGEREFLGKVALVTGGGSGIGRETARLLAARGAAVVIADVQAERGREAVEQIRAVEGQAEFVKANVSRASDAAKMVNTALKRFGALDILFNNAGIAPPSRKGVAELSEQEWDQVINTNLKGVFLVSRAAIPPLVRQKGCIVNMASTVAMRVDSKGPAYSVSKAGVVALTKCLALELAPQGVRVNCLLPGGVDTPMSRQLGGMSWEARIRSWSQQHPIGRGGQAHEIAEAVLFLASEKASFITGAELVVDGGHLVS